MAILEPSTALLHHLNDGEEHCLKGLLEALPFDRLQITRAIRRLRVCGFLLKGKRGCYRLNAKGKRAAQSGLIIARGNPKLGADYFRPHKNNTLRQRAWRDMRIATTFTIGELVLHAAREQDKTPEVNLRNYVWCLRKAGYLLALPRKDVKTQIRYRLIKDTGPISPSYNQKRKAMIDFNLNKEGEEVLCK
ncbi:hypothetical protein [Flexibacterium corallicola]|uniref:hypothetical protein n=1 Tax=Flexibacterium corallicola TaxID=3037259 RepID=UPI00286F2267|nr:hypothetical protein [Pseudovibrio sp. M1P-2-3]